MNTTALEFAKKAKELSVLPDVYFQLKELLDNENSTLDEISKLVVLDPALSSALLKIANSAFYNFPREIDSIDRAMMILGLKEVTNLVNLYGVTKAFDNIDTSIINLDRFWEISVDCALICKFIAKKKSFKNIESLFLSGLFHNLGELAVMQSAPKQVQYCEAYNSDETPWQRQEDVFGFTYADCTAELLTLWQLPESIIKPIREYHRAYSEELEADSSILYIASRVAILNSHPGMYSKKSFLGQHIMKDYDISMNDINEAIDFCNLEGLNILSALSLKK